MLKDGVAFKESPFIDKNQSKFTETLEIKPTKDNDKIKRGPVRTDAKGKYKYKITCHNGTGQDQLIDPIIEIPKPPPKTELPTDAKTPSPSR